MRIKENLKKFDDNSDSPRQSDGNKESYHNPDVKNFVDEAESKPEKNHPSEVSS